MTAWLEHLSPWVTFAVWAAWILLAGWCAWLLLEDRS